jgi:hypothetical protein
MNYHEKMFIAAFVTKAYRKRCLAKKGIPRDDLWHKLDWKLEDATTLELPANIKQPDRILEALRRLYPVETGFCISAHSGIDGNTITMDEFEDLLDGTIVSFIPGKLAYYTTEDYKPTFQCLLVRDPELRKKAAIILKDLSAYYRRADAGQSKKPM